jgi:hypothetical protein
MPTGSPVAALTWAHATNGTRARRAGAPSGAKGALALSLCMHGEHKATTLAGTVDVLRCACAKGLPEVTYAMLAGYDRCLARHLSCPHPHPPVGRPRLGNVALYTGGRHHVAAGCTCGCESPPDPDPATLYTHGPPPGLKSNRVSPSLSIAPCTSCHAWAGDCIV